MKQEAALTSFKGEARVSFAGNHYKEGEDDTHDCHPFKEGPDEGGQRADTPKTCIQSRVPTSGGCYLGLPDHAFMQCQAAGSASRQKNTIHALLLMPIALTLPARQSCWLVSQGSCAQVFPENFWNRTEGLGLQQCCLAESQEHPSTCPGIPEGLTVRRSISFSQGCQTP